MRRRKVWGDTVNELRDFSLIDLLTKSLSADFIGKDGADYSGLTRELFTGLFINAEGQILHGPSEHLSILKDNKKLRDREYCLWFTD